MIYLDGPWNWSRSISYFFSSAIDSEGDNSLNTFTKKGVTIHQDLQQIQLIFN